MKKFIVFAIVLISFAFITTVSVSAQPINITNYTVSDTQGMQVSQLEYTPFPANPGEYVDVWIEAQFYGTDTPSNATFILEPKFPFSLDPNQSAIQSFGQVGYNTIVLHYKIRINNNAVPGDNELDLAYSSNGNLNSLSIYHFEIQVQNSQTNFDLVIQDSTSSGTSIGIANTGENTANSLIVKIPQQPNFRITGVTNGQILGNLNAGDYTLATFQIAQTNPRNSTLEVELDYTDAIGIRRTIIKDISIGTSSSEAGISATTGSAIENFRGNSSNIARYGSGAYFQKRQSIFSNVWFWIVISIVILAGLFMGYRSYKNKRRTSIISGSEKKKESKTSPERKKRKENSKEPDWVTAERAKKGK